MTIYQNDFEGDLSGITGAKTIDFRGSRVLGNYNNDGFSLRLTDLPKHKWINLRFRLNVHDSWDGNPVGVGGPDIWWFRVSRGNRYVQKDYVFATTFSNTPCNFEPFCLRQAYPNSHPHATNSKTGFHTTAPGLCHQANRSDGTTTYILDQVIGHDGSELFIEFRDSLKQDNAPDMLCDESWTLDDLEIISWE